MSGALVPAHLNWRACGDGLNDFSQKGGVHGRQKNLNLATAGQAHGPGVFGADPKSDLP
ncbi:MAG: hypothetical protein VXZ96_04640 [Myxococcota bacterium]|nr:hypothetical protein [Myxococcota bacterium]